MKNSQESQKSYNTFQWLERFCAERSATQHNENPAEFNCDSALSAWQSAQSILGVSSSKLLEMIANHFELEIASSPKTVSEKLLHYVPLKVAEQYMVFPLAMNNGEITVASPNPFDRDMESMLEFLTTFRVNSQLAQPELITKWIEQHYQEGMLSQDDLVIKSSSTPTNNDNVHAASDSAIVKIVSEMLLEAFIMKASDIHIEPFHGGGIVRYRIDGMLRVISEIPAQVLTHIVQRIKAIAALDLAKKMVPQDGSVSLEMKGQDVDLRVSTLPVKGGEKVVIRLLIKSGVNKLDEIGLHHRELASFKRLLQSSEGIFIITGPTGSGKTSTLYAALNELNEPEKCLVTVEDPVEYEVEGIAQVNINTAQKLTFSDALRSILRQDPDVILMGEVRDEETAAITFRAAITGHFVMTTLHTSDAITAIPRLVGLGISPTVIADSLKGVAAQRLVRKLCTECAQPGPLADDKHGERFKQMFPNLNVKSAVGCEHCNNTGYSGRMPLFEIITLDHRLADAIRAGVESMTLRKIAAESGSRSLYNVALEAISNGLTSAAEINRVLGESFWQEVHLNN
jgi:type II secretory ATPase GspE/PulE/Tfp pilus assembly ATPase PilB-like protein